MDQGACFSVDEENFLENEEFNFDLVVSPVERTFNSPEALNNEAAEEEALEEDEDEVFFGPVGFKEQCVEKKIELATPKESKPMSPLTTEQFVEIFKEANRVVLLLKDQEENTDGKESSKTGVKKDDKKKTNGKKLSKSGVHKDDKQVDRLTDSISELKLKNNGVTQDKSEMEKFKRNVKKDMRSPRRTTYTIAVSPAGQPPPPHLPTAEECVSSLKYKPEGQIKFTAEKTQIAQKKPAVSVATKKSRLPAKKSGIPKTSGLRMPKPVSKKPKEITKMSSPPKRTRLLSGESTEGINRVSNISPELSSKANTLCAGKRRMPGCNNPVLNGNRANAVGTANGNKKLPKSGLMKPNLIPRKTLAITRPSKTTVSAVKASKMKTPCTPVFQEKNFVPKRILSSGGLSATKMTPRTTRAFSVDSAIKNPRPKTPQRKPSVPVTPQKSAQKVTSGSARRRSCIPTPSKLSLSSAKTGGVKAQSSLSNSSPRLVPSHAQGRKPLQPSPMETPPPPKVSPGLPTERARMENTGASPELTANPNHKKPTISGRTALSEIKRNMPSPQVDLLIQLDTPSPMTKDVKGSLLDLDEDICLAKKCLTPVNLADKAKENYNLIDLL